MSKIRVVLADDHTLVRGGIRALLESIPNVEVVAESGDGREALELIGRHEPEVALLDIGMPGMNGLEVARRLRLRNRIPRPLIVAITGWGKPEDETLSREAGFDLHMVKPVEELDVLKILRTHSGIVH